VTPRLFKPGPTHSTPLFPLSLKKEGAEGHPKCLNSDLYQDKDTCPSPSESPEDINRESHSSDSPESIIQNIPETISSSRRIDHPEDTLETDPSILSKTTFATNSISSLLHLWGLLRRQIIPCFTHGPLLLLQRRQSQKAADIALTIKGRISAVTEESQRAVHEIIESSMTRSIKKNPRCIRQ